MRFSYEEHGMQCEFVLMTIGDYRGGSVIPVPSATRNTSTRRSTRPEPEKIQTTETSKEKSTEMPPPLQPASRSFVRMDASQQQARLSLPVRPIGIVHESLFIPQDEDESLWGESKYDDEQDDQLGWGAGGNNVRTPLDAQVSIVYSWNLELIYDCLASKLDKSARSCEDTSQ